MLEQLCYNNFMKKKRRRQNLNSPSSKYASGADPELKEKVPQIPEKEKNPAAVALGRLGGLKGGKARAKKLSKEKRQEIARKAALARWKK